MRVASARVDIRPEYGIDLGRMSTQAFFFHRDAAQLPVQVPIRLAMRG